MITISIGKPSFQKIENKSKYTRELFDDYVVLDLETTGMIPTLDEVIEAAALRIRNGAIVDSFQSLIKPRYEIDDFITDLNGITNEMVADAPSIEEVAPKLFEFVGDDPIIGHNVSFDLGFLNQIECLENIHGDTMHLARKVFPDIKNHKLETLTDYLNLSQNEHRSLADCTATFELYERLKKELADRSLTIKDLYKKNYEKKKATWDPQNYSQSDKCEIDLSSIESDPDNYFYGIHCCFTGKLEKLTRMDAWQLLSQIGGIPDKNVTKDTNYLVLGNLDLPQIRDQKSNKQKNAEKKKAKGQDIEVITEQQFYELINI